MSVFEPKPPIWSIRPNAVDPIWQEFWTQALAVVPAWENAIGQAPMIIGLGNVISQTYNTPQFCTKVGSATWGTAQLGISLSMPSTGDDWRIPITPSGYDIIGTSRVTYLIVRQRKSATLSQGNSMGIQAGGQLNSVAGAIYPYTDSHVYWDFGNNAGANRLVWSGYTVSAKVEVWAFVAGTMGSAIYFNGEQVAVQSTAITRTVNSASTGTIGMNVGDLITTSDGADILFFAVLDAEWNAGQVQFWSEDPFGPLRLSLAKFAPSPAAAAIVTSIPIGIMGLASAEW
jgi:hypothetical protein